MTRAVRFEKFGGPEQLRLDTVELPPLADDEVRIQVRAIGLNRAESMFRSGGYYEPAVFPSRLGYEASGVVEAVGAQVDTIRIGEAVSVVPPTSIARWGTYGDVIHVPARFVACNPVGAGWDQAAALWMASLTAYGGLIEYAGLQRGDYVVINAASSGVGIAAIQIAKHVGAIPIALTRTSAKRSELLEVGAAEVIATKEEDLVGRIDQITRSAGPRVVFDPVAGSVLEFAQLMAPSGVLVIYGVLDPKPFLPLGALIGKNLTIRGFSFKQLMTDPARVDAMKQFVLEAWRAGALRPVISKSFRLEEIIEATQYMESNQQLGKVVVTVDRAGSLNPEPTP